jgi:hypothetical protein
MCTPLKYSMRAVTDVKFLRKHDLSENLRRATSEVLKGSMWPTSQKTSRHPNFKHIRITTGIALILKVEWS